MASRTRGWAASVERLRSALVATALAGFAVLAGCDGAPPAGIAVTTTLPPAATTATTTTTTGDGAAVVVRYRVERRTGDAVTADFETVVHATLADRRGWVRAGFRFVADPDAEYRIVLAEGAEVDALCFPYRTHGEFSCQNGPVVALNADRWRVAHRKWTGDVATYRQMLVNHEVGHLVGQHHPDVQCPVPGRPAAVMAQQSTELGGCLPNPWPLDHEIERAARHDLKLAPGYGE